MMAKILVRKYIFRWYKDDLISSNISKKAASSNFTAIRSKFDSGALQP